MAATHKESLSELERQAEATRAELARTVDELHSRVSPDAIKADMRNYARDTGQQMLGTIEAKMRENPLQAMAVAVGLAYPLWRFIGRMPAPVLLIGAGLAMSARKGSGTSYGSRSYEDEYAYGDGGLKTAASDTVSAVKEKAADLGSQATDKLHDTVESVRTTASDTMARASDMLSSTYQSGRETAAHAQEQVIESYARVRDSAVDVVERHPMLVGGIAFAVGSLLASAVPVSRQENRLLGETADELKRRTQDLAASGMEQAKTAAQQVYETASTEIAEDGLTPDVARRTARAAVETAREAVDAVTGQAGSANPQTSHSGE